MPLLLPDSPERAPSLSNPATFEPDNSAMLAWFKLLVDTMKDKSVLIAADKTQSPTDTTAGRLLKVGDFGLGTDSTPLITDFAVDLKPGFYRALGGGSGAIGHPDALGYQSTVIVTRGSGSTTPHTNFLVQRNSGSGNVGRAWFGYRGGATGAIIWTEIYLSHSILGTVTQSGGVPTGALIQFGTGPNGDFVRLADGTQICTRVIAVDTNSGALQTFTAPAAFAATGVISASISLAEADMEGVGVADRLQAAKEIVVGASTTKIAARYSATPPNKGVVSFRTLSIGRWF